MTPALTVKGGAQALAFYTEVFRAPFGHGWVIATHVEDVKPDEMTRRLAAFQA